MNKRQRSFVIRLALVIFITIAMVVAVVNFKEYINKSETMTAMRALSMELHQYRKETGNFPSQEYVEDIEKTLPGSARAGEIIYRIKWIDYMSEPDTILAYSEKDFSSLFISDGYVVLRLNGKVQWLSEEEFETEMALQWGIEEQR